MTLSVCSLLFDLGFFWCRQGLSDLWHTQLSLNLNLDSLNILFRRLFVLLTSCLRNHKNGIALVLNIGMADTNRTSLLFLLIDVGVHVRVTLVFARYVRNDDSFLIAIPNSFCFWWLFSGYRHLDSLLIHDCSAGTIPVCYLIFTFVCVVTVLEASLTPYHS